METDQNDPETSKERDEKKCCVTGCTNSSSENNISFHSFPKSETDSERYSAWLSASGGATASPGTSKMNNNLFVCHAHFEDQFICHGDNDNNQLRDDAVPTLNLPDDDTASQEDVPTKCLTTDKRNPRRCMAFGCGQNKLKSPHFTLFSVPQDKKEHKQWMRLLGRIDWLHKSFSCYQVVCESHFDPRDFLFLSYRKTLKKHVKPTRNLPTFKRIDCANTVTGNTTNRNLAFNNFHTLCDTFLSQELSEIVKSQTGYNFFDNTVQSYMPFKIFCLRLYYTSAQAYWMLKNALRLPLRKKIKNMKISVSSRLNAEMISMLKMKVSKMTTTEKNCAVIAGTIDVKRCLYYNITADRIVGFAEVDDAQSTKPANRVIAVLTQGIVSDWMQPVGFAMLSEDTDQEKLSKWIDSVISVLLEIGLNVRAFVTGLQADFTRTSKKRCVDADDPFFFINDRKIYYFYDSLLLMQAAYNNLFTYDFHFENNRVAKFKHIVEFYEQDIAKVVRQAVNLTSEHIEPSNVEKLTVKHAEDVLSKAVGTGISTHVSFNCIDQSGEDTAQFILLINKLKETLTNKLFYGKKSQLSFLSRMVNLFYSLQLFNHNGEKNEYVLFKEAFEITIRSTLLLMEDLKTEGHKFMKISNHDALRNLNKKFLSKFGKSTSKKPTCQQFVTVFRSLYLRNAVQPTESGRLADVRNILVEFVDVVKEHNKIARTQTQNDPLATGTAIFKEVRRADYCSLRIKPNDSLFKICGFLLLRCLQYHPQCEKLRQYSDYLPSKAHAYAVYENYVLTNVTYSLKTIPPDDFIFYVERLEKKLSEAFNTEYMKNPIASSMYELVKDIKLSPLPCLCFPSSYLQTLFIRMRLFFLVKLNNRAMQKDQEFSV